MRLTGVSEPARSAAPARSAPPRARAGLLRLQRSAGNRAVGRVLARRDLDCPGYDQGEVQRSRTGAGILTHDVLLRGAGHMLIADFAVDSSTVKPETKRDPDLQSWIAAFERDRSYRLSILGLDDCVGSREKRERLRKDRARSVRDLLGADAKARVAVADAAPVDEYTDANTDPGGRAMNRSVLVAFRQDIDFEPVDATPPPRPKPPARPTVDCEQSQSDELAEAYPVAVAMVDHALRSLPGADSTDPMVKALLRKYFNDDGVSTHIHVRAGFLRIQRGLKTDFTFECEQNGWMCDGTTYAYVWPVVGWRVHMCKYAFGKGPVDLASTIVHETSHKFDFTGDKEGCAGGCSLDRWAAYDNADSYAEFAKDVFRTVR
jgi:outer membrane protein OmpA-like peptidoglycan-associated protein